MTTAVLFALAACLGIPGASERITARDLAPAFPALAEAAPDTVVGLAPAPGVKRIFRGPELQALGERWSASPVPAGEVCVERPLRTLDPERIREAMLKQIPGAKLRMLEFSRFPAPEGELEFPLAGLRVTAGTATWNGWVRYGADRKFRVWARVEVTLAAERIVATDVLRAGQVITAAQVRLEKREAIPSGRAFAGTLDEVVGKIVRRPVAAGTALESAWLDTPRDVSRGETVRVEVRQGGALLELEGEAEASGSVGQRIPVLNPVSKKRFFARVEAKGRVSVGSL
jgi:flagella basal body P-ring formation protein FlgA